MKILIVLVLLVAIIETIEAKGKRRKVESLKTYSKETTDEDVKLGGNGEQSSEEQRSGPSEESLESDKPKKRCKRNNWIFPKWRNLLQGWRQPRRQDGTRRFGKSPGYGGKPVNPADPPPEVPSNPEAPKEEPSVPEEQPAEEPINQEAPKEEPSVPEKQPAEELSVPEEQPAAEPSNQEAPKEEPSVPEKQPAEEPSVPEEQPAEESSVPEEPTRFKKSR